jgi:hypothetical protein
MAMAIHGGYLAVQKICEHLVPGKNLSESKRLLIEKNFQAAWTENFSGRLAAGRLLQKLSGKTFLTGVVIKVLNNSPFLKRQVIKSTHGKVLEPVIDRSTHQLHQVSHP